MSNNPPRDKSITTWFKFKLPEDILLDESLFHALHPTMKEWSHACYGRVKESPQDCVLLLNWYRTRSWLEFSQSESYAELLSSLGSHSDVPVVTEIIDFNRDYVTIALSSHTELKRVYFPSSISQETRRAVWDRVRHLAPSVAYGKKFQHRNPYIMGPSLGWVEEDVRWEGQEAVACVWVHKWKSQEIEERFKATARYPHMKDGELIKPLTLDLFEQGLRDLGALGWEECHVGFETHCYIP
ncbi:antibiotic biosynthesis monooxygenase [Fusarium globosum]|uniref:Antibiotic biosynthesis monooxygenase n=1 Tax=Fusarium globosum TaxID=78864 RepID=A0A8H6DG70_9HYPO|nr:antibiotic biosynthesis monooxygenase [Fusarium globosum]